LRVIVVDTFYNLLKDNAHFTRLSVLFVEMLLAYIILIVKISENC